MERRTNIHHTDHGKQLLTSIASSNIEKRQLDRIMSWDSIKMNLQKLRWRPQIQGRHSACIVHNLESLYPGAHAQGVKWSVCIVCTSILVVVNYDVHGCWFYDCKLTHARQDLKSFSYCIILSWKSDKSSPWRWHAKLTASEEFYTRAIQM